MGRRGNGYYDLDVWLGWAAALVVGAAAFQTLAYLCAMSLSGWGFPDYPLVPPDGHYALLLLTGVLLLVLRRRPATITLPGWARGVACLAAGTGAAVVVAQVGGWVGDSVQQWGGEVASPAYRAADVVATLNGVAGAVIAALAAVLAVLLYRWSPAATGPAMEDRPESAPGDGSGEDWPADGIADGGPSNWPERGFSGSVRPAVACLALGALVAGACLVVFAIGTVRTATGIFTPTSGTPIYAVPSPSGALTPSSGSVEVCSRSEAGGVTFTWICTGGGAAGVTFTQVSNPYDDTPLASPSPSPSS